MFQNVFNRLLLRNLSLQTIFSRNSKMITMIFTLFFVNSVLTEPNFFDLKVCELTDAGIRHLSRLSRAKMNLTCLHWNSLSEMDDLFKPFGDNRTCQNFCRNLDKRAYCIVRDTKNDLGFSSEHCRPRACGLNDCTVDIGNEQSKTRTKRHSELAADPNEFLITNYSSDMIEKKADGFQFTSPQTEDPKGVTFDGNLQGDSSSITDSEKPVGCTLLVSTYLSGTYVYILPKWRKYGLEFWVKAWNPHIYEGLIISMSSIDESREYLLLIGDKDNEKVSLYYKEPNSDILLEQNTMPHLLPAGKWAGYWLKPGDGKIELGYQGTSNSFFEWTSTDEGLAFEPFIMNFGSMKNNWIAASFQCTECFTVKTSASEEGKRYPINLWRGEIFTSDLLLNLKGIGSAIITLMWTKDFRKKFAIQISSHKKNILLLQYLGDNQVKILADFPVHTKISDSTWSEYVISYTESSLTVDKNGISLFSWESPFPLVFYWFSVSTVEGCITWSANCSPADTEGEPRDGNWGKWGPWSCSVSCGKGEGKLERLCNDPPPNVFGHYCEGPGVYYGPCNDFPCGEISPGTNDLIRNYLSSQYKSFYVGAKEKVVLTCNSKARELVSSEVSKVNISWTHNGFSFRRTRFQLDENYSLVIPHAHEKHNGIYMCLAYQNPNSITPKVVLEVISLVVIKPKPTKKVRKGRSFTLKCNGLSLSNVYAHLSQKWELNGKVWKDYGLGNLQTYTAEQVNNISNSHAGIWTCVVTQEDFRFKWTTNWIYLSVTSAPSFWSNLKEDITSPSLLSKFGDERKTTILISVIAGIVIVAVITIVIIMLLR